MFGDWIDRLKTFLFEIKFVKDPSFGAGDVRRDLILGASRAAAKRQATTSVAGEGGEEATCAGVFEACFCEGGRVGSEEEQTVLLCIEQLTLAR